MAPCLTLPQKALIAAPAAHHRVLAQATMSFRALFTRLHPTIHAATLPHSILMGYHPPLGKDRPQITMLKANANSTAPVVASRPKPNALIKIRTARIRERANSLQLISRASGTRTFHSYGNTLYTPITIYTSTRTYLKRASNFLRKNWNPFWGHHLQRTTSSVHL
jgi:hypothetical protein